MVAPGTEAPILDWQQFAGSFPRRKGAPGADYRGYTRGYSKRLGETCLTAPLREASGGLLVPSSYDTHLC